MSRRALTLAAVLLSASVAASRVLGFLREVVIADVLGAGRETDAYLAAFVVPDLINHFLAGGALSTALLPLYARARDDADRAWRLVSQVTTATCVMLSAAIIAAWFLTPGIVRAWYPGFDAEQVALTTRLTRIILPGPLLFTVGALLNTAEQARARFWASALMPLIYNGAIIVAGLACGRRFGVEAFSWGVLAGALAGPLLVPVFATRDIARLRPVLAFGDPDLRRFVVLATPVLISSSLLFFDEWFGRRFASELGEGAITWLNNARRLMLLPAAMVGQAVGQALFPFLARVHAAGDAAEARGLVEGTLRATVGLGLVATFGLIALGGAVIEVVFVRGAYTSSDAAMTADVLVLLALAVPGWSLYSVVLRALQAAERTWLSSAIGAATLVPSYFVYDALTASHGLRGLAVATPLCVSASAAVLTVALSRAQRVGVLRPIAWGGVDGCAVGCAAWAATAAWMRWGVPLGGTRWPGLVVSVTVFGLAAVAALSVLPGASGRAMRRRLAPALAGR